MKASDKAKILAESDLLGAYVVDMHTVLNLTDNYDGQKTGQHGLFARLVDKLPQKLGRDLKASPDAARYLDNPNEYVFSMMTATYVWLDNTLYLEELARRGQARLRRHLPRGPRASASARTCASGSRAPRRTRAATGTRRGRWRGGPELK